MLGGWIRNTAIVYEPKELKSDIVNAMDHNCSFHALHGIEDQQINLRVYSRAQLWTTMYLWKSQTVSTSDLNEKVLCAVNERSLIMLLQFVTQVSLTISGRIRGVTQCGVELLNLSPCLSVLSARDDSHALTG